MANPPKGGDAKLRVYSPKATTAGLPSVSRRDAFGLGCPEAWVEGTSPA